MSKTITCCRCNRPITVTLAPDADEAVIAVLEKIVICDHCSLAPKPRQPSQPANIERREPYADD